MLVLLVSVNIWVKSNWQSTHIRNCWPPGVGIICFEQTGFPHTSQNLVFVVFFFLCIFPEITSFSNATWTTRRFGLVSLVGSDDDVDEVLLLREARENHERLVFLAMAAVALLSLLLEVVEAVVYGLLNKHGTHTSSSNGTFHFWHWAVKPNFRTCSKWSKACVCNFNK